MDSSRTSMVPGGEGGVTSSPPAALMFPAGLRVLVVDDDPTCLKILEKMLSKCLYDVTTCSRAVVALSKLRERKGEFDLVLSDVYMPDMDGFKLLEHIGLEMDLPVIMMSADDGKNVVMKGVTHGACDYLIKPVRMEALKNIWQHVVRKRRNELKELENSGSVEESDKQKRTLDDGDNASSANEGSWKNVKRRKEGKEEEDEIEEHEDSSTLKKPRVVWSVELHQQFVAAVNQLGVDKAVPKKILELMNVPGLTRENVASHLQKYRLYLRRVSVSQHQGRFDTAFTGASEAAFGSSSSLDGFDLQALAVSGQLTPQSLMTMHAGASRVANSATGISAVDQIGFFNSDAQIANSSRIRSASGQLLTNKQMNLLCGPFTSMESTQLGQSQKAIQSYGNMGLQVSERTSGLNLPSSLRTSSSFPGGTINGHLSNSFDMQMTQRGQHFSLSQQQNNVHIDMQCQPQLRGQLLNGFAGEHNTMLSSTIGQHILSNEISGHVSGRDRTTINGNTSLGGTYTNSSSYGAVPQAQSSEFQNSCVTESAGNYYPLVSSMGASSHISTGRFQEAVPATGSVQALSNTTSLKGVEDFIPSYDLFSELCQSKSQDWKLQNINLSYEAAQHLGSKQSNIDFGSSNSAHQDFNATLKDGSSRNICTVRKEIISVRADIERKVGCIAQHNSTYLVENSGRVTAESMPDPSGRDVLFSDNIIPNELMSVIARQPQEGVGQGETEFNFDGYPLDDIPV